MTARTNLREADLLRAAKVAQKLGLAVKVVRDAAYLIPAAMVPVDDSPPRPEQPEEW